MIRRRSTPWIYRWSRPAIGAIAILGALNTGYLTYERLIGGSVACPTDGCAKVLQSSYATVLGQPLALFGLLAYLAMAIMALAPLLINPETHKSRRANLETITWPLLFAGATAMLLFSGYLMYIMFSQFVAKFGLGGLCYFCLASALFATAMFVLTLIGREWEEKGQLVFIGAIVAMVTLVGTLGIYAPKVGPAGGEGVIGAADGTVFFTVKNTSGAAELELARHLKQVGAKMYAAYWCPHCYEQKELFGKEAMKLLPYIECAEGGVNAQPATCSQRAPEIEKQTGQKFGFPTWEINGRFYTGRQPLAELARASDYKGPQSFKNAMP
jgi:uncharacterized membrane protein